MHPNEFVRRFTASLIVSCPECQDDVHRGDLIAHRKRHSRTYQPSNTSAKEIMAKLEDSFDSVSIQNEKYIYYFLL